MKIIELRAENVKRLQAVQITPEGSLVVIGGKNGAGKSSVLDAILYALGGAGTLPGKPVRRGADKAEIEVTLDGDRTLVVRRRITEGGKTSLEIEQRNEDGSIAKIASPQKLLDSLVGSIAFDPLAFTRLRPQDQVEILRTSVGVQVDDIDRAERTAFESRAEVNRDVKRIEAQLAGMPQHADTPAEPIVVDEVLAEIEAAQATNRKRHEAFAEVRNAEAEIASNAERIRVNVAEVKRLELQLAEARKLVDHYSEARVRLDLLAEDLRKQAQAMPEIDCDPLADRLRQADAINAKVRANRERAKHVEHLQAAREQAEDLTRQIEDLRRQRIDRLAAAPWPVDGLGFGENGVTFQGLPFEQCSSAEQLRISTAIALAQNPKLPIAIIRDGSLLDADSLAIVGELAAERGAQLWIERVGDGEECSVVIEDGTIAARELATA